MEEWRQIAEAPGYEVSSDARVRNVKTGRILRQHIIGKLPTVTLMEGGFRLVRSVPKLVREEFGGW